MLLLFYRRSAHLVWAQTIADFDKSALKKKSAWGCGGMAAMSHRSEPWISDERQRTWAEGST